MFVRVINQYVNFGNKGMLRFYKHETARSIVRPSFITIAEEAQDKLKEK